MTYTFNVHIDLHKGERRVSPDRVAKAIARVLTHAQEVDIEGAELLDSRWGQITVTAGPTSTVIKRGGTSATK